MLNWKRAFFPYKFFVWFNQRSCLNCCAFVSFLSFLFNYHPNGFATKTKLKRFIAMHCIYIAQRNTKIDWFCYNVCLIDNVKMRTHRLYNQLTLCCTLTVGKYAIACFAAAATATAHCYILAMHLQIHAANAYCIVSFVWIVVSVAIECFRSGQR